MSRNMTISVTESLVTEICIDCGVLFALPDELRDRLIHTHKNFYCPNGHHMAYIGPSEAEKERKAREAAERREANLRSLLAAEEAAHQHSRNRLRATKAAATKARKRAEKGICPHPGCKRYFVDVHRHVERCHPDFAAAVETGAVHA